MHALDTAHAIAECCTSAERIYYSLYRQLHCGSPLCVLSSAHIYMAKLGLQSIMDAMDKYLLAVPLHLTYICSTSLEPICVTVSTVVNMSNVVRKEWQY